MKYKFAILPWAIYTLSYHGENIRLVCMFHVITLTQFEFHGLLAIGKLERIFNS